MSSTKRIRAIAVASALGIALAAWTACGGEGGQAGGGQEAAAGGAAAAPTIQNPATIGGSVKFTGTPPKPEPIDMSEEQACAGKYTSGPTAEDVIVNTNGTLQNVFVYVKEGLPADMTWPAPAEPKVLDQDGCRYHPHVLGIQVGQKLQIRNSDPVLHNINAKPQAQRGFNISQPVEGMTTERTFNQPEVMVSVECDVHGWMNAYIGVLPHPFYGVTGDQGSFTLQGLPAGTYTIEAWHERYGTSTQTVTVGEGETKTIEFTFSATA
ncbi:MAG: carboxypeptidase regulatory-like domain-containing protein [Gemmatimonadota bacterium]